MLVRISRVMNKTEKIFVAGHRGMVGSALTRALETAGFTNLIKRDRSQLDLGDSAAVAKFFAKEKPEIVIFAAAKVGGIKANNDNFDLETSHVLAAILRKAFEAKKSGARELVVWGTGTPRREFLQVDDCASACLYLLEKYDSPEIVNVGCGEDISIRELAELVCQ